MNLVFVHDHKLRLIAGKYYTVGGLRDSIMTRYLNWFDHLTIMCRSINQQNYDSQLFEIKDSRITVKPVSNGSLILSKRSLQLMEDEIKHADGLVVKLHSVIAEYAIHYARKYNIPYLIEVVGCPWDAYWNHGLTGKLIAPLMTAITKFELKRAPLAIYVTKHFLEERYPCGGNWIDCSDVELQDFSFNVIEKRLEKINSYSDNKILTFGTLAQIDVKYKGQELVIEAISKLKKIGKIFKYKLAGSGKEEYLRSIASKLGVLDQIEFCGVLSHEEVFQWLDDIDYYIQPSKQEGLPRAVVEAISRGCPVICSDAGGMSELIQKDYIFKKGSVEGIVNLFNKINVPVMKQQAEHNFETARNYEKNYLDNKRNQFYEKFASICKNNLNKLLDSHITK